jgi:hypothetical protein
MVCVICSKHEHIGSFITGVLMSWSGNWIVVYIITTEQKNYLNWYDNYLFYKNFENVPYKIVFSRCQIRVQESARMHDFVPFSPELPQTPCRTATALCAVGQPAKRVEGPLHVVEGY